MAFVRIFVIISSIMSTAAHAENLKWTVENPFRLLNSAKKHIKQFSAKYQEIIQNTAPLASPSDVDRELHKYAREKNVIGWAALLINDTCMHRKSGSVNGGLYTKCENYVIPKTHRVKIELPSKLKIKFHDKICTWSTVHNPPSGWLAKSEPGSIAHKFECNKEFKTNVLWGKGASETGVKVFISGEQKLIANTLIKVKDSLIIGLGDSFASGEGNPDVPVKLSDHKASYGRITIKQPLSGGGPQSRILRKL